ncbi:MAG: hypothetical protein RI556_12620 [Hydrogenovibrio sp.]|uniref:hypothetical protein n=1 Tax=Hydrogenovibrio sp. TaxID=2065821 RepID=UPI0028700B20|nr:hypothetical protein [Hydrogenovibrio sp.]MDR9500013.1 hypothetical protein [Hydrogenovibrio sp.]
MQVELSRKVESAISQMMVGAMAYDVPAKSTRPGRFSGLEIAGTLADGQPGKKEARAAWLALFIAVGMDRDGDKAELFRLVLELHLIQTDWFEPRRFLKCPDYRHRVSSMVMVIIDHLNKQGSPHIIQLAKAMGVSPRAVRKTWIKRQYPIIHQLQGWLVEAGRKVV